MAVSVHEEHTQHTVVSSGNYEARIAVTEGRQKIILIRFLDGPTEFFTTRIDANSPNPQHLIEILQATQDLIKSKMK